MFRPSSAVLLLLLTACGGAPTTPPANPEPSANESAQGSADVPAEDIPAEPPPVAEPRVDGVWATTSSLLPFQTMHIYRYSPPGGEEGSWCAHLDAQALGAWPVAVDNDAGTFGLWLRPGGPAGSPPPPAAGAPCPGVFPSTGPSDAMLSLRAPAALQCQLVESVLRCTERGRDVDFINVTDRLGLEALSALQGENRSPHSVMTGTMSCGTCAAGWDRSVVHQGSGVSLDGEMLYPVRAIVAQLLRVLAANPSARFSLDTPCPEEDCLDEDVE